MRHVYIKPSSPNLNGKVERSHLTDELEFGLTKKSQRWAGT